MGERGLTWAMWTFLQKVAKHTAPRAGTRLGYVHDRNEDHLARVAKAYGLVATQWPARGWRLTPAGRSALARQEGRDG